MISLFENIVQRKVIGQGIGGRVGELSGALLGGGLLGYLGSDDVGGEGGGR